MLSFLSYLFVWVKYFRSFGEIVMSKCKSIKSQLYYVASFFSSWPINTWEKHSIRKALIFENSYILVSCYVVSVTEKEMATHSSVLAWRIPGTVEPGGLRSMGSHRVCHNSINLAATAAVSVTERLFNSFPQKAYSSAEENKSSVSSDSISYFVSYLTCSELPVWREQFWFMEHLLHYGKIPYYRWSQNPNHD